MDCLCTHQAVTVYTHTWLCWAVNLTVLLCVSLTVLLYWCCVGSCRLMRQPRNRQGLRQPHRDDCCNECMYLRTYSHRCPWRMLLSTLLLTIPRWSRPLHCEQTSSCSCACCSHGYAKGHSPAALQTHMHARGPRYPSLAVMRIHVNAYSPTYPHTG